MEVILDNEKNPRGVFLPLTEWEALKNGISTAHQLYKLMDDLSHPDVFDLSPDQFSEHLSSTAQQAVQDALDNGLYISYPAGEKGTFVHQYKDGSKEIVGFDKETGEEIVIVSR